MSISKPKQSENKNASHAVVIGSSMAGLLAARVLVDHFERVTIIERDRLPESPLARKGVPQSHHLHVLLRRGLLILEELFPELSQELVSAGAKVIDTGADLAWLTPAGWAVRFPAGLTKLACSRPLLEWAVRRRLMTAGRVCFLEDAEVPGLMANAQSSGIAGVTIRFRKGSNEESLRTYRMFADLVVDTTGRGSRTPKWLAELGYESPKETVVNAFLGYASRLYQPPAGFKADWKAVFLQAAPPKINRAGVLFPIDGERWLLTVAGVGRDYPPTDDVGFMNFVGNLRSSIIYDAIKSAEPVSPIYSYRATENRWRHYEQIKLPEGLLLMGDSVCAFNPVYGQGMTIAALNAVTLAECLLQQRKRHPNGSLVGLSGRFQKRIAKLNKVAWDLATSEDYRYSVTEGAKPKIMTRLMHRYMDHVISLTTRDAKIRRLWLEVFHMLRPPTAMFGLAVICKVIGHAIRRHRPEYSNAPDSGKISSGLLNETFGTANDLS